MQEVGHPQSAQNALEFLYSSSLVLISGLKQGVRFDTLKDVRVVAPERRTSLETASKQAVSLIGTRFRPPACHRPYRVP